MNHTPAERPPENGAQPVAALIEACAPLLSEIRERVAAALRTTFLSEKTAELEAIDALANRLRLHLEAANELARFEGATLVLDQAVFSLPELIARALKTGSGRSAPTLSVAPGVPDLVLGDAAHLERIVRAILDRASRAAGEELGVLLGLASATGDAFRLRFEWRVPEGAEPSEEWAAIRRDIDDAPPRATPRSSPLSVAALVARAMSGEVTCAETPHGRRSIDLVVELPAERADPRTDETVLEELRGRPVLVLDGKEESRASLVSLLTEMGLRPFVTAYPEEAISRMRLAATSRQPFALLIVDPFLRGSAVFRARRNDDDSLAAATPQVILVSERAGPDNGYGPDTARLVRPVTRGDLIAALRRTLREAPWSGESNERRTLARPLRILVVQEGDEDASTSARAIERLGHRAAIVRDAVEAGRALASQSFDGAVVGLGPSLVADLEGVRELRQAAARRGEPFWILATTARSDAGEEQACRAAGADHYLARPFPLAALRAVLPHLETAADGPAAPAIDWPRLRAQLAGNEAALADLLGQFGGLAETMLGALARGVAEGSPAATERAAHSLKGSLLWMHAAPAADLAKRIEMQARAGDLSRAEPALEALRREMARLLEAIANEGPRRPSPPSP